MSSSLSSCAREWMRCASRLTSSCSGPWWIKCQDTRGGARPLNCGVMRHSSVRFLAVLIAICCHGAASGQSVHVWTDQEIVARLPSFFANPRLLTIDSLTPEQRRQVVADERMGFKFERDLNGDGVLDVVALGTYGLGDWPHTFLIVVAGDGPAGPRVLALSFAEPFIIGTEYPDGVGVSFCLNCDCGGRIEWNGEHFQFT